jgi:hypothetical protein
LNRCFKERQSTYELFIQAVVDDTIESMRESIMGQSNGRDAYFSKNIKSVETPTGYIQALKDSPYKTHKRMAVALEHEFCELLAQKEANENTN